MRAGYPRWNFEVLESAGGVHSNIVGPLPPASAEALFGYSYMGEPYAPHLHIQPVIEFKGGMAGLVGHGVYPGYLGKEFGEKYQLGDGGGEKLRLSESLEDELLGKGLIEARRKVYSSRSLPKPETPKTVSAPAVEPARPMRRAARLHFRRAADRHSVEDRSEADRARPVSTGGRRSLRHEAAPLQQRGRPSS